MDVDVAKQQRRVIVLEQDVALRVAQLSSLKAQMSSKEETTNQLQGDVNLLMTVVYDLKAKLEKNFGSELADKDDDPMNVAQHERTAKEKPNATVEREAGLDAYLAAEQKKKR
ncbi:hypothetical protein Hanom_Chr06g00540051 [Helianthus anomalus]